MTYFTSLRPLAVRCRLHVFRAAIVLPLALNFMLGTVASAVTITTTNGMGADAEVSENSNNSFDGGSGIGTSVNARFSNLDRNEYVALRFDLAGYSPSSVSHAALTLFNFRTNGAGSTLRFYGVAAGAVGKDGNGVLRGYTAENWNEADIRFSTMPGLDWDGSATTRSQDLPNLTDLGTLLHTPVEEGTSLTFSNAALTTFLQTHATNLVTLLVMRDSTNGGQARFATKEAVATATSLLTGVVGDFAPRISFDDVSSTAPIITGLADQAVAAGDNTTFSPVVTGVPTPLLQWRQNGMNMAGATNATLTLASVLLAQNGYVYSLVASNSAGVVTNSATLTVVGLTPAFPGAEGAGGNSIGGRGGDVYYVTTLADSGAGSLRTGIATAPTTGRTICFKVSGNIQCASNIKIDHRRLTIAGQTAPGDGICLQNYTLDVQASDVILRHIRSRLGTNALQEDDGIWINSGTNIIVDHCSASWSVDETLSATANARNLTVQWCYITESLQNSIHSKGAHGYAGIIAPNGTTTFSYHHNLYAHHDSRNPRVGNQSTNETLRLDFRNNVIYDWGFRAGYSGAAEEHAEMNYVGNYLIAGPSSTSTSAFLGGDVNTAIYQSSNYLDVNKNGRVDGVDTGWSMFSGAYTPTNAPFSVPTLTVESAGTAYQRVLAQAGAMPWHRDPHDQRITGTVRRQYGTLVDFVGDPNQATEYVTNNISGTNYIGVRGWPALASVAAPTDTDGDGMPDYWETALGLATNNPADRNTTNSLGYTRLEDYLNWLAAPHTLCNRNGSVDFDLRAANGGATNLAFVLANGTNGTVALLGDGYTARFTATNNYTGLANFTYTATEPTNSLSFGPDSLGVLVTTTYSLNTPPVLAAISNYTMIAGATLAFTNSASDTDIPAQSLTFSLLDNPANAVVTTNTGVFTWRPAIAQGGSSNAMKIVVTDSGSPALSATQAFSVVVSVPANPTLQTAGMSNGQFSLFLSGNAGPDYLIQTSTNLANWSDTTNFIAPVLPLNWSDPNAANFNQRYYRIRLGP